MKRTGRVPLSKRMKAEDLMAANGQGQPVMWSEQGSEKDLLLRHPNFVAKPTNASFEPPPLVCEASALSAELTAPNRIYFRLKIQLCKGGHLLRQILPSGSGACSRQRNHPAAISVLLPSP